VLLLNKQHSLAKLRAPEREREREWVLLLYFVRAISFPAVGKM
jgi:hypothetical protein